MNNKTKEKLIRYQELYDHSKKMINIGNKLDDIAEKYFLNNKKRIMISDVIQLIESEILFLSNIGVYTRMSDFCR